MGFGELAAQGGEHGEGEDEVADGPAPNEEDFTFGFVGWRLQGKGDWG